MEVKVRDCPPPTRTLDHSDCETGKSLPNRAIRLREEQSGFTQVKKKTLTVVSGTASRTLRVFAQSLDITLGRPKFEFTPSKC
jgi:hypothetical protein